MQCTRSLFAAATAVLLAASSLAAHADALDTIKQRKKVLIGVDIGAPPYGFLDDKAQQAGSDVEAARLLAKDLGVEVEIVPVTGPNRVPYLLSKKADIVMASFSITDERKKVIDFSEPYGVVPIVVAGPKAVALAGFADLKGKNIAVTRGTTSDQALTAGVKDLGATVVRYEDDATTNTAVSTGQQDYLAAAISVVPAVKKANPSRDIEIKFTMKAFPYGVGLRKDEPALKAWLDGWVKTNLKNGRLNDIYKRNFGMALPAEFTN